MSREFLTVKESFDSICEMIANKYESRGWKYLKSQRCVKKIINDLVFEIRFFGSKWNTMGQSVKIDGECSIWYKKLDNSLNVNSSVGFFQYRPTDFKWDITYKDQFPAVVEEFCELINKTAIPLTESLEVDFYGTVCKLAQNSVENKQCIPLNLRIEFIDVCAGREYAEIFARNYYSALNAIEKIRFKRDLKLYKNGVRDKSHMINPSTFKYIADNSISYVG